MISSLDALITPFVVPGIPWVLFWIFVGVAIVIQGISKSGFAGGAGILSLPLMMLVMPVDKVTACLLPLLILCDFNAIWHHRRNKDWAKIRAIFFPALIGIVLGAGVWCYIGREGVDAYSGALKRFVGIMAILFAGYIFAKEISLQWVAGREFGAVAATWMGIAAGFTSTLAHAAGPIVSLWMFSQGMGKSLFVGTVAWTFTLINLAKLPFYLGVGLIDTQILLFDLFLIPLIPLGSWLGHWMHHHIAERPFNRVILVLTLIAGIQLLLNVNVILWILAGVTGIT